jgi:mannose-6-phosphate isomerase-like protein (cupin superfamily)
MKSVETTKTGKNFTAVSVGKLSEMKDYLLQLGDIQIPGKVFVGQALGTTGSELSFQTFAPGQDGGFLHTHKNHEELYFILRGEGLYQVDGENIPVGEGKYLHNIKFLHKKEMGVRSKARLNFITPGILI